MIKVEMYEISKEELENQFIGQFWTHYNELISDLQDYDCKVLDDDSEYIDFECEGIVYRANLIKANSTIAIKSINELGDIDDPKIIDYYGFDYENYDESKIIQNIKKFNDRRSEV